MKARYFSDQTPVRSVNSMGENQACQNSSENPSTAVISSVVCSDLPVIGMMEKLW